MHLERLGDRRPRTLSLDGVVADGRRDGTARRKQTQNQNEKLEDNSRHSLYLTPSLFLFHSNALLLLVVRCNSNASEACSDGGNGFLGRLSRLSGLCVTSTAARSVGSRKKEMVADIVWSTRTGDLATMAFVRRQRGGGESGIRGSRGPEHTLSPSFSVTEGQGGNLLSHQLCCNTSTASTLKDTSSLSETPERLTQPAQRSIAPLPPELVALTTRQQPGCFHTHGHRSRRQLIHPYSLVKWRAHFTFRCHHAQTIDSPRPSGLIR